MVLDLKSEEGRAIFFRLAERGRRDRREHARPGEAPARASTTRRCGGSIRGSSTPRSRASARTGPYGHRAGVDQIAQGMGGLMSITGQPGSGPVRVGIPITDLTAGNLLALGGHDGPVRSGEAPARAAGSTPACSKPWSSCSTSRPRAGCWPGRWRARPATTIRPRSRPGVFPTADRPITIAASSPRMWERFCEALGRPDWKDRAGWSTREAAPSAAPRSTGRSRRVTATQPSLHWIELLDEAGIPCGPINTIDQVFEDPQVEHLALGPAGRPSAPGRAAAGRHPINLEGMQDEIRAPPLESGQHGAEILGELGYDEAADRRAAIQARDHEGRPSCSMAPR